MLYTNEKSLVKGGLVAICCGLFFYYNVISFIPFANNYIFHASWEIPVQKADLKSELLSHVKCADYRNVLRQQELKEEIEEEIRLGEIEMLAQLIEAEAGNQDYLGKRLVADVVLNRISEGWGDSVEEIILADNQFAVIANGRFDDAGWFISDESFEVAYEEYNAEFRYNESVLYFTAGKYNDYGTPAFKYGDHYFSYK